MQGVRTLSQLRFDDRGNPCKRTQMSRRGTRCDDRWMEAMWSKSGYIMKKSTCDLINQPPKHKVIGTKWVYNIKYKSDNTLDKYKVAHVAKGLVQAHGFDYPNTFAPIAQLTTIRSVSVLVVHENWTMFNLDVKFTFQNGDLNEVYVEQSLGFLLMGSKGKVCKLKKAFMV